MFNKCNIQILHVHTNYMKTVHVMKPMLAAENEQMNLVNEKRLCVQ